MRRLISVLLISAMATLGGIALAQDKPTDRKPAAADTKVKKTIPQSEIDTIDLLLRGHDFFPTRERLEKASANAPEILFNIVNDETALPSLRTRAADALGLFEGREDVATYLQARLGEGQLNHKVMRHLVTSSMKAFGQRALPWVNPYLQHADLNTRLSAVHAIGTFGGDEGIRALRVRETIERDALVKEHITRFAK